MTPAPTHSQTPGHQVRQALWSVLVVVTVVLPWINPFSSGPRANTIPLLVSGFCALALVVGYAMLQRGAERNPCQPTVLFVAWLLAALLSSAMGLLQYFGLADTLSPWVNLTTVGSAFGNLRQRNQFASLTSIGLVSVLYLAGNFNAAANRHQGAGAQLHQTIRWGLILATLALLATANAASASRTGALQWLMLAALCWLTPLRTHRMIASAALFLYTVAVVLLPALLELTTGLDPSGLIDRLRESAGCESRWILWANVIELIAQKPWFGWGWGELKFAHFIHPYAGDRFCDILDNAHNLPLQLAVELGLPLATAIVAGVLWWVWHMRPWQETDASRQAAWAVLAVIAIHSLVEYPLWYGPFQMAVGLCIWLLWPYTGQSRLRNQSTTTMAALGVVAGLLTLAFLIYTAWDYTRVSQLYLTKVQRLAAYREDTLAKARPSVLFAHEVQFAELTTFALNVDSAPRQYTLAGQLLHFSPEPTVLQTLLESAHLLGVTDPSLHTIDQQFKLAYPKAYEQWMRKIEP